MTLEEGLRVPTRSTVNTLLHAVLLVSAVGLLVGCPPEHFPDAVPPTIPDIARISQDASLSVQEKRAQLEALGLSPLTVNVILRGERLGNQLGGDLRTAYEKVVGDRLTELTPDEVQFYGDGARTVDSTLSTQFGDATAQEIVSFLQKYDLRNRTQLGVFLGQHPELVPTAIPDGVLKALFVDFDPDRLLSQLP